MPLALSNQATAGNYSQVRELQEVMTQPYAEQSKEVDEKYYRLGQLAVGVNWCVCENSFGRFPLFS
jgi:hypothetical protein